MRRAWTVLAAVALFAPFSHAVPRRAAGVVARRAPPRLAAPPRPAVDLQVAGLAPGARRFHAVLHAIHRDAVPALAACVSANPGARGVAAVTLTPGRRGAVQAELHSALPAPLTRCMQEASARVVLPPLEIVDDEHEQEQLEGVVRFELRVRLPTVGAR